MDDLLFERAIPAQSAIFRFWLNVEKHGFKFRPMQGWPSQIVEHTAGSLRAIDHGENLQHTDLCVETLLGLRPARRVARFGADLGFDRSRPLNLGLCPYPGRS